MPKGKCMDMSVRAQKAVVDSWLQDRVDEILKQGRTRIPGIGIVRLQSKKATKAGTRLIFGKEMHVKAKPATKKVKLRVAKDLKEKVNRKYTKK